MSLASDLPMPASGGEDLVLRVHDALGAEALGVTERTVRRDWEKARLLLAGMLA